MDLRDLSSIQDLAQCLNLSVKQLLYYSNVDKEKLYFGFIIKKKNGGVRNIFAPEYHLKEIQRALNVILLDSYHPKKCVLGFRAGKSILDNAKIHVKNNYLMNIDLTNFFPSITSSRVFGIFKAYCKNRQIASLLTNLVVFRGALPQGAPTSPIIANMVSFQLDRELIKLCTSNNVYYTRYADDLTFSSSKSFNEKFCNQALNKPGEELRSIIERCGFKINDDKFRTASRYDHQEVTGIVVNQFPNVRQQYIKNLRKLLFIYHKYGKDAAGGWYYSKVRKYSNRQGEPFDIDLVIKGQLSFISFIRGAKNNRFRVYNKYASLFNSLSSDKSLELLDPHPDWRTNVVVIQLDFEDGNWSQGSGFIIERNFLITAAHLLNSLHGTSRVKANIFSTDPDGTPKYIFPEDFPHIYSCIIENNVDEDWAILSLPKPMDDLPITVGKSINVNRDSKVSILGFPTYSRGDTYTVLESRVNSDRDSVKYLNIRMCTVDHPIIHGTSGGPVLDKNGKIIGVTSAGTNSAEEESRRSGFILIDSIISALDKHKSS